MKTDDKFRLEEQDSRVLMALWNSNEAGWLPFCGGLPPLPGGCSGRKLLQTNICCCFVATIASLWCQVLSVGGGNESNTHTHTHARARTHTQSPTPPDPCVVPGCVRGRAGRVGLVPNKCPNTLCI